MAQEMGRPGAPLVSEANRRRSSELLNLLQQLVQVLDRQPQVAGPATQLAWYPLTPNRGGPH